MKLFYSYVKKLSLIKKGWSNPNTVKGLLGGCLLHINLNSRLTKFDVDKFVTASKKSRKSMGRRVKYKPILQYRLVGICIAFSAKGLGSNIILRNVLSLAPFEILFPIFSPLIASWGVTYPSSKKFIRAKLFYLRRKIATKSLIRFSYVWL